MLPNVIDVEDDLKKSKNILVSAKMAQGCTTGISPELPGGDYICKIVTLYVE